MPWWTCGAGAGAAVRRSGVVAVGASNQAVLNGGLNGMDVPGVPMTRRWRGAEADHPKRRPCVRDADFFGAAGIRIVAGRDFTERDADDAAFVAIINESMARFYFGSPKAPRSAGRSISRIDARRRKKSSASPMITCGRRRAIRRSNSALLPYRHPEAINRDCRSRLRVMLVAVRAAGNPLTIASAVRTEIRHIDPMLPVIKINTTDQQLDDVLAQDRLVASLSTALSVIAVFLASLGLFGLLTYRVARRTNEIGVRLAFGATRGSVLRMVLAESGRLVAIGLVAGVVAAAVLAPVRIVALVRDHCH